MIRKEFVFFDGFCPTFPDWVGPGDQAGSGYLNEYYDRSSSLHVVHFR